jgi:hypothetical protein
MSWSPGDDRILAELRDLPRNDMDPGRTRAVRDRACAILARRRRRGVRVFEAFGAFYGAVLEPVLVGGLALGFLAWVVARCAEALHQGAGLLF